MLIWCSEVGEEERIVPITPRSARLLYHLWWWQGTPSLSWSSQRHWLSMFHLFDVFFQYFSCQLIFCMGFCFLILKLLIVPIVYLPCNWELCVLWSCTCTTNYCTYLRDNWFNQNSLEPRLGLKLELFMNGLHII